MWIDRHRNRVFFRFLIALCMSLGLVHCGHYQLTLNEAVVYSPKPLFTDFEVADINLRNCLDQTIKDHNYSSAGQLRQLNCSHAGIKSIQGLSLFAQLEQLDLSFNELQDLNEIQLLTRLRNLQLQHNHLAEIPQLLSLLRLEQLDVSENPDLLCRELWQLKDQQTLELTPPEHCQRAPTGPIQSQGRTSDR